MPAPVSSQHQQSYHREDEPHEEDRLYEDFVTVHRQTPLTICRPASMHASHLTVLAAVDTMTIHVIVTASDTAAIVHADAVAMVLTVASLI